MYAGLLIRTRSTESQAWHLQPRGVGRLNCREDMLHAVSLGEGLLFKGSLQRFGVTALMFTMGGLLPVRLSGSNLHAFSTDNKDTDEMR